QVANENTQTAERDYEELTNLQPIRPIYHFDNDVRGGKDLSFSDGKVKLRGYGKDINLDLANKYSDMSD
ncbi:MAG: hypothetical protein ACKVKR_07760, partial [Pseudomonadales bacterium]